MARVQRAGGTVDRQLRDRAHRRGAAIADGRGAPALGAGADRSELLERLGAAARSSSGEQELEVGREALTVHDDRGPARETYLHPRGKRARGPARRAARRAGER